MWCNSKIFSINSCCQFCFRRIINWTIQIQKKNLAHIFSCSNLFKVYGMGMILMLFELLPTFWLCSCRVFVQLQTLHTVFICMYIISVAGKTKLITRNACTIWDKTSCSRRMPSTARTRIGNLCKYSRSSQNILFYFSVFLLFFFRYFSQDKRNRFFFIIIYYNKTKTKKLQSKMNMWATKAKINKK